MRETLNAFNAAEDSEECSTPTTDRQRDLAGRKFGQYARGHLRRTSRVAKAIRNGKTCYGMRDAIIAEHRCLQGKPECST